MMKEFKFEDGSKIVFEFQDGGFSVTLQAVNPGKELKITSARAVLNDEELTELVNWIGDTLISEENDV